MTGYCLLLRVLLVSRNFGRSVLDPIEEFAGRDFRIFGL